MTTGSAPDPEFYKKVAYELGRELARQHQRELQRELDLDDQIARELSNDPDYWRY